MNEKIPSSNIALADLEPGCRDRDGTAKPCQFFVNENYNHFEMMETSGNPYGLLGRAVLTQMQLPG